MGIRTTRKQADDLKRSAEAALIARNDHIERSWHLARDAAASPAGLAAIFGVGMAVGWRKPKRDSSRSRDDYAAMGNGNGAGAGSDNAGEAPWIATAIKLCSGLVVNALVRKNHQPLPDETGGSGGADAPDSA